MELTVVLAFVVGFVCLVLLFGKTVLVSSKRLPPGPRPLPILGNFPLIWKFGSIHDLANDLIRTYGPIVTLWMGSTPAIIISGPELLQDSMITQGNVYMGRPTYDSVAIVNNNFRGLNTSDAERHRFFRKLLVIEIFSNSRITGFKPIRDQEGDMLIDSLRRQARESGGVLTDFRSAIRLAVSNMILGICFGRRLTLEEYVEMDKVMVQRFRMHLGKPRDFIPLLKLFPDKKGNELQLALRTTINNFFQPLIEERRRLLASGKAPEKHSIVDTLLELQSDPKQSVEITDADVVLVCLEILGAGTDTTSLNVEYSIANLINHPQIQEKLFQEISAVVGEKKMVDESDIPRLPYLQAVTKEGLRRHSPARLAVPRVPVSSSKIAGYDIPVNSIVFQHLEAVAMNPQIWEEPLEFRPDRFLDKIVDVTGSTGIVLVPFGVGRRICPAINIAFLHLHLIVARLIQAFEWKSATPGQFLDVTPEPALITAPMKYPLTAFLREREGGLEV